MSSLNLMAKPSKPKLIPHNGGFLASGYSMHYERLAVWGKTEQSALANFVSAAANQPDGLTGRGNATVRARQLRYVV